MKTTFKILDFTNSGLKQIAKVEGDWKDLAVKCAEIYVADWATDEYPLAAIVETYIQNTASDNGLNFEDLKWEDFYLNVSEDVMHTNSPFIYKGSSKTNLTSFPDEVYKTIDQLTYAECKAYFDKETVEAEAPKKERKTPERPNYNKAKVTGTYANPTKAWPNRWAACYREDGQTKRIGFFDGQEAAEAAKLEYNKRKEEEAKKASSSTTLTEDERKELRSKESLRLTTELANKTVKDLREFAKTYNVKNYWSLNKKELIENTVENMMIKYDETNQ